MSKLEGKFSYFTAWASMAYHPEMNLKALRLFDRIDYLSNKRGYCWAHNDDLAYFSSQSEQLIDKNLKLLEDLGFIKRETVKETYLNKIGKRKIKSVRKIYVTLDKNVVPNYVPTTELKPINNNNDLIDPPIQNRGGGTIQNRGVINNTNFNSTNLSKDKYKDSSNPSNLSNSSIEKKEQPKKEYKIPFLLKEWRTYPQVPTSQHHPKEDTKIHKRINYLTTLFLKGKVGAVCTKFDPTFLKKNNIDAYKLNYTYSEDELLAGLDEMSKMFLEGNYPENKDSISKRSFDSLLYCNRTHMSYFMRYLWNNVIPLPYKTVKVWDNWLDELYDQEIFDKEIETDNHQFGILKRGLKGIEEYYDWMVENPLKGYNFEQINDEDKFFNGYVEWLIERGFNNLTPYDIGPQNNKWYQFIKWLEEAIHGDFTHQFPTWNKRNYEN